MDIMKLIVKVLLGLLLLCLFVFLGELIFCDNIPFKGIVLQKIYVPERSSIGIGTGITPNGYVATVITSNNEFEKYQLIVKIENEIITADCSPETYFSVKDSDMVKGEFYIGPLTKILYGAHIFKGITND
jgi:hypothetical protein